MLINHSGSCSKIAAAGTIIGSNSLLGHSKKAALNAYAFALIPLFLQKA
ncbi:MAG: hypothetical protein Q8L15_17190 [Methylobacter sp.]|nr:hypothetical protein [Methylobacter sp.]